MIIGNGRTVGRWRFNSDNSQGADRHCRLRLDSGCIRVCAATDTWAFARQRGLRRPAQHRSTSHAMMFHQAIRCRNPKSSVRSAPVKFGNPDQDRPLLIPKYPKTPHWPYSPSLGDAPRSLVHPNPHKFVGCHVVVTEKLDGSNTLVHRGQTYGRSVTEASARKWMAMVKKHIAWKVEDHDVLLYGEDIYAVHSVQYDPVPENHTFYAFALRRRDSFAPFSEVESYAGHRGIPVVPVLYRGEFTSLTELRSFVESAHAEPSELGGKREGVVVRVASGFPATEFSQNLCKSVRTNHITTTDDWTRKWQACRTLPPRFLSGGVH